VHNQAVPQACWESRRKKRQKRGGKRDGNTTADFEPEPSELEKKSTGEIGPRRGGGPPKWTQSPRGTKKHLVIGVGKIGSEGTSPAKIREGEGGVKKKRSNGARGSFNGGKNTMIESASCCKARHAGLLRKVLLEVGKGD